MNTSKFSMALLGTGLAWTLSACTLDGGDDDHDDDHGHEHEETEVISRVELTFTPTAGGDPLVFAFSDPDGDGGESGVSETVTLAADTEYSLSLAFLNDLEEPVEDITEEIEAEAEEHFVLVAGAGVTGPGSDGADALAVHAYADLESDYGENAEGEDLPVGLINTFSTQDPGTSSLRVMLRHVPELNGVPQKSSELPERFAAGEAIAGDVDVDVSFELIIE